MRRSRTSRRGWSAEGRTFRTVDTSSSTARIIVEPDFFQFYLRRAGAPWASDQVSDDGYDKHLWTDGAFVYVGTRRKYGSTVVDVVLLQAKPDRPDPSWQHVVEVSLEAGDPTIEVFSWDAVPDAPTAVVHAVAAPIRLRASWTGLVPGRFEGLDEHGESDERLLLELWPEPPSEDRVIRAWPDWSDRST